MSDGPHRSLDMRRGWKKAAEFADNPACAKADVNSAVTSAFAGDWRLDVPDTLVSAVCNILGGEQDSLFRDQAVMQLEALRGITAGHGLGQVLIDCAVQRMVNGGPGPDAAVEATETALAIWGARHGRQIDEHFCRASTDRRAQNVRRRIEEEIGSASFQQLIRQLLQPDTTPAPHTPPKKTGVDDGVQLP